MRITRIFLALLLLSGCDRAANESPDPSVQQATAPEFGERWQYPRERTDRRPPHHRPCAADPQLGQVRALHCAGRGRIPRERRGREIRRRRTFRRHGRRPEGTARKDREAESGSRHVHGREPSADQEETLRRGVESEPLEVPLDMFLLYLERRRAETPPPAGFNTKAPPIYVVETPAFLLFINGEAGDWRRSRRPASKSSSTRIFRRCATRRAARTT